MSQVIKKISEKSIIPMGKNPNTFRKWSLNQFPTVNVPCLICLFTLHVTLHSVISLFTLHMTPHSSVVYQLGCSQTDLIGHNSTSQK